MTKPSSASGVTFRSIDDLFEPTDGSSEKGTLTELPVDSLIPFEKHPFREYPEEQMQEMVDSVSQYGVLMPIACIIYSVFAEAPSVVDSSASATSAVWSYLLELIVNLLVLVGAVRMSDRLIHEMIGM